MYHIENLISNAALINLIDLKLGKFEGSSDRDCDKEVLGEFYYRGY